MTTWSMPITFEIARGALVSMKGDNSLWVGTTNGLVMTFRLLDGAVRLRRAGYSDPVSVLPTRDGLGVVVVQKNGRIFLAARSLADHNRASLLSDIDRPVCSAGPNSQVLGFACAPAVFPKAVLARA